MPAERFSPAKYDEEAKRTGTEGLPLFEWVRSKEMRGEGKRVIAEEVKKDVPDFRHIADVAETLAERLPQRARQEEPVETPPAPPAAVELRDGVEAASVREAVRAMVTDDVWQYFHQRWTDASTARDPFDASIAASLRAIDADRFDREVSADMRAQLWEHGARALKEDRTTMVPMIQLMKLEHLRRLDPERFTKEVDVAGDEWKDIRGAIGRLLVDHPEHAVYAVAIAKRIFGESILTSKREHITHQWDKWVELARLDLVREPDAGISMMAWLQQIVPEGKEKPVPTTAEWERARGELSRFGFAPSIRFGMLANLMDLEVWRDVDFNAKRE